MSGDRLDAFGTVLVVVGVVAILLPAAFPVQQVLYHETRIGETGNESQLEQQGYTVVAYENLSDRGQELYVAALRADGAYTVPAGEGAAAFPYRTDAGLRDIEDYERRRALTSVAIERPRDADLPPADEPVEMVEYEAENRPDSVNQSDIERRQRTTARYDVMQVRRGTPPLSASSNLLRLGAIAVGVVAVGVGGYLRASPRRDGE